jgi:hypothetical protein
MNDLDDRLLLAGEGHCIGRFLRGGDVAARLSMSSTI